MCDLSKYFKSIIDMDTASVVVCNTEHEIIYMNPAAAQNYSKRGGASLVGRSLLACHNEHSVMMIEKVLEWFKKDDNNNIVHTFFNESKNKDVYMVALRDENSKLIGYYEKHEFRSRDMSPLYDIF